MKVRPTIQPTQSIRFFIVQSSLRECRTGVGFSRNLRRSKLLLPIFQADHLILAQSPECLKQALSHERKEEASIHERGFRASVSRSGSFRRSRTRRRRNNRAEHRSAVAPMVPAKSISVELRPPDPLARHHAVAAPLAVGDHRRAVDHHVLDSDRRRRRRPRIRVASDCFRIE
jgi:hypothetical protein